MTFGLAHRSLPSPFSNISVPKRTWISCQFSRLALKNGYHPNFYPSHMTDLQPIFDFLQEDHDPREIRRALAVKFTLEGHPHRKITKLLGVSSAFISKWKKVYLDRGIEALQLHYKGNIGYLTGEQKQEVIEWIDAQTYWSIRQLKVYLFEQYGILFKSRQSYYLLLKAVGGQLAPGELERLDEELEPI